MVLPSRLSRLPGERVSKQKYTFLGSWTGLLALPLEPRKVFPSTVSVA